MTKHQLKTWPDYFTAILTGTKTFEVRINDRDYKVGDVLQLQEYHLYEGAYTGRTTEVIVTYLMEGESWALQPGMCVMSIVLTEGSKLRLQKATSTDPDRLEELAVFADQVMERGKSHFCVDCCKQWFAKDDARCSDATCPFRLPAP